MIRSLIRSGDQMSTDQPTERHSPQAAMDKTEPNNPDTLRDWGGLLLRDMSKTEVARKSAAAPNYWFASWKTGSAPPPCSLPSVSI